MTNPILDRVTITGADDSVKPDAMIQLTREFPFVEWAILASESNTITHGGSGRYPGLLWIHEFQKIDEYKRKALHINGKWVRKLLIGENVLPPGLLVNFDRIQLNFHAERTECRPAEFADQLKRVFGGRDIIFQLDNQAGNAHLTAAMAREVKRCYGLFDTSGGAGILPKAWPTPIHVNGTRWDYHGYAGGLGPDNLAVQIPAILQAAAASSDGEIEAGSIWIDMETHVRSQDDKQFDLVKVRDCLKIAEPFVRM